MTSLAVISSAVTRINCLKELLHNLPKETDELLESLEGIKAELLDDGNVELEKQIVRLSYDIVDAIADASSASKEMFSGKLSFLKTNGNTKLIKLKEKLNGFHDELKKKKKNPEAHPEHEPPVSPGSEQQKPKGKSKVVTKLIPWKRRTTTSPGSENQAGMEQQNNKEKNEQEAESPRSQVEAGEQKQNPDSAKTEVDVLPRLKESLKESTVVYLVGASGMGKSNLANKLFHDLQVGSSFDVCAWVPLNRNFQIRRVLQVLLQKLGAEQEQDMRDMNETQLIAHIFAALKNKKYLLVLDGIWSVEDWESIRLALPILDPSRIIITTSSEDFTKLPHSHQILGMTQPNILSLLKKKANFKHGSEKVGKAIFDISGGSPLLATILGRSIQFDAATTSQQQLLDDLHSYQKNRGTPRVLGACYKRLAPELKPCLLYMGLFPLGQDIEVEKLYLLLAAENLLLLPKESQTSLPFLIEQFEALARIKLIEGQEDIVSTRGNNKSYRLHEQVLEFCRFKGLEEEFIEIVHVGSSAKVGIHARRLAIHFSRFKGGSCSIQFNSPNTLKKILSLMIFDTSESAEEESDWPSEINDLREFVHLRILNFDGVDFINLRNIPRGVDRLVLLRYLSFRGCLLEELPSSLSNLTQLETLDLVVQADCDVFIHKRTLTNMKRMMHLYLPLIYHSNGMLELQSLERLEILVNFNTEVCNVKALPQFKNLKIISTISSGHTNNLDFVIDFINERGDKLQQSSVDIKCPDYCNEESISALENLLDCKFVHSIHIEGQIGDIPREHNRAERVADIVLDGSEFEDDPMNYLGIFENLQRLVLKNDAFVGSEIVIAAAAPPASLFCNLRSLKLQNLQYLEKLTIERGAMPNLLTLQIENCDCLQELSIPKELDEKLKKNQGGKRGNAYRIMPLPPKFNIISP